MQLISFMTQHYFSISYEKFTDKLIAGMGIFRVISSAPLGAVTNKKESILDGDDYKRLLFIEEDTHENLSIPLYKLDRVVNPHKGNFQAIKNYTEFITNIKDEDMDGEFKKKKLDDRSIQYYLCKAIREVNDIVVKNLKDYSDEFKIPIFEEETDVIKV